MGETPAKLPSLAPPAHARELSANVVVALFRLVKLSTLHSLDNQAMVRQVDETVQLVGEYGQRTLHNVSILFAHGSVFVGGQLLRANRGVYEGALELGEILSKVGAAEIGIRREAQGADFYALASVLADALRKPKPPRIDRPSPNIRLRGLAASALLRENVTSERVDPTVQVARTYASAVVIMRRFFEDLRRGKYELPQRVKRVAQRLVDLSTGETPAFLGVTAARNQNHDEAGRAVNTAILALAMTRQVTNDMVQLSRIAMAALLHDCARARISGVVGMPLGGVVPQYSEQQENEAAAGTAVVLTALGRINEPSMMRTVISYEAHWEKRRARLGPVYRGLRAASLQARILNVARSFNDALTPAPGQSPPSADETIAKLEQEAADAADRTVIRLLIGALGIFTTGTIVKLSTGETGIVVQTPAHPSLYAQPRVRLVLDERGGWIQPPLELDLAHAHKSRRPGEASRHIKEIVATSDDPAGAQLRAYASGPSAPSGVRVHPGVAGSVYPPPPSSQRDPPSNPRSELSYQVTPASFERPPRDDLEAYAAEGDPMAIEDEVTNALPEPEPTDRPRIPSSMGSQAPPNPGLPRSPPTAEGSLQKTPFVHLLIYMLDQRLSGTAVFTLPSGVVHSVYFHDGTPAKVRTGTMLEPLDRVLVDEGMLDEATLRGTLMEVSKKQILHGRLLVMKGLLDREKVVHALRLQVLRKVTHLFELPGDTRYAYYKDENLLTTYGGPELTPTEPLAVIMAGIRLMAGDPLVDATLGKIVGRPLALHLDAEMKRFQLTSDEHSVVDTIRTRKMTLDELLHASVAQPRIVRQTVYALVITRHLDLGGAAKAPVGLGRPPVTTEAIRQADRSTSIPPPSVTMGAPAPKPLVTMGAPAPKPLVTMGAPAPKPPAQPAAPTMGASSPAAKPRTRTGTLGGDASLGPPPGAPSPAAAPSRTIPPQAPSPQYSAPRQSHPSLPPQPLYSTPPAAKPRARTGTLGGDASLGPPPPVPLPQAAAPETAAQVTVGGDLPPPPAERPEIAARRADIEKRAQVIDGEDYYQMLGVTPESTDDQIKSAYFALAKSWHPDRLPAELLGVKPLVARVFARFSEAYQTLVDPVKSKEYAAVSKSGGGSPDDQEIVARVVDAALEFQKAEILLRKHDIAGAEQLATHAVQADPDQPEYMALLVWIHAMRRGDPPSLREGQVSTHYDDLIKNLDAILAKEKEFERALYYRGVLLKRSGHLDRAIRDFRLAAKLNPKNLDAVREVRLFDMRRRATGGAGHKGGEQDGLFGKFFKR